MVDEVVVDECPPAICTVEQCLKELIQNNTKFTPDSCSKGGVTVDLYINEGAVGKKGRKVGGCGKSLSIDAQLIIHIESDHCSAGSSCNAALISKQIRNLLTDSDAECCTSVAYERFERIPASKGDSEYWTDFYTLSYQEN